MASDSHPKDTGYTPGEDGFTRWRNWFSLITGQMTHEGKEQYRKAANLRHEEADCKRCEKQRDYLLSYSKEARGCVCNETKALGANSLVYRSCDPVSARQHQQARCRPELREHLLQEMRDEDFRRLRSAYWHTTVCQRDAESGACGGHARSWYARASGENTTKLLTRLSRNDTRVGSSTLQSRLG